MSDSAHFLRESIIAYLKKVKFILKQLSFFLRYVVHGKTES